MKPRIITSTDDFADLVRRCREERGLTHLELDDILMMADGQTSKIEAFDARWGKTPFRMHFNADMYLQGLDLALVAMPRDEALALVSRADEREARRVRRQGQTIRSRERLVCVKTRTRRS